MKRVTAITTQKRNPERVNIFLDGTYAFGLSRIVAAWLQVGQVLSEEKIAELQLEDANEVAHLQAVKYISYRERSEAEVRQHLSKRNLPKAIIDDVVLRLQNNGLVDDQRFALNWVENRMEFRPRGHRALSYELLQKGISRENIQLALAHCNEEEMAYRAAIKQSKKLEQLEWNEYRKKLYSFLARRGFTYEVSALIVARVWDEISLRTRSDDIDFNKEVDL